MEGEQQDFIFSDGFFVICVTNSIHHLQYDLK